MSTSVLSFKGGSSVDEGDALAGEIILAG